MTVLGARFGLQLALEEWDNTAPQVRRVLVDVLGNAPWSKRYTAGTSNGQIDTIYGRALTLGAGASADRDLRGSLVDNFGATISFAELVGGCVVNLSTTATVICSFGPKAANGFLGFFGDASDRFKVYPAADASDPGIAFFHAPQGVAVTAGTADIWEFTNLDGSNAFSGYLFLWGRTA